ncbi:unnamed protein product, partial [Ilex paraguariensis]
VDHQPDRIDQNDYRIELRCGPCHHKSDKSQRLAGGGEENDGWDQEYRHRNLEKHDQMI